MKLFNQLKFPKKSENPLHLNLLINLVIVKLQSDKQVSKT